MTAGELIAQIQAVPGYRPEMEIEVRSPQLTATHGGSGLECTVSSRRLWISGVKRHNAAQCAPDRTDLEISTEIAP